MNPLIEWLLRIGDLPALIGAKPLYVALAGTCWLVSEPSDGHVPGDRTAVILVAVILEAIVVANNTVAILLLEGVL